MADLLLMLLSSDACFVADDVDMHRNGNLLPGRSEILGNIVKQVCVMQKIENVWVLAHSYLNGYLYNI